MVLRSPHFGAFLAGKRAICVLVLATVVGFSTVLRSATVEQYNIRRFEHTNVANYCQAVAGMSDRCGHVSVHVVVLAG